MNPNGIVLYISKDKTEIGVNLITLEKILNLNYSLTDVSFENAYVQKIGKESNIVNPVAALDLISLNYPVSVVNFYKEGILSWVKELVKAVEKSNNKKINKLLEKVGLEIDFQNTEIKAGQEEGVGTVVGFRECLGQAETVYTFPYVYKGCVTRPWC